jgi:hypothetical protein
MMSARSKKRRFSPVRSSTRIAECARMSPAKVPVSGSGERSDTVALIIAPTRFSSEPQRR